MHPAIRLVNCILLILMLASGLPLALLIAGLIILALLIHACRQHLPPDIAAIWRLRWLFLSILLLYLLFPPVAGVETGRALLAGLLEAGHRIAALVAIVLLVQILFALTGRRHVLAGLLWLLQPLTRLGLPSERFALRLVLVMELVPQAQSLLKQQTVTTAGSGRLGRVADRLAAAFREIEVRAQAAAGGRLGVPVPGAPTAGQWLSPALLLGLFAGIYLAA